MKIKFLITSALNFQTPKIFLYFLNENNFLPLNDKSLINQLIIWKIFILIFLGEFLVKITPLAQWLGASNSCVNPMLYFFFNAKFRAYFKKAIRKNFFCFSSKVNRKKAKNSNETQVWIRNDFKKRRELKNWFLKGIFNTKAGTEAKVL